MGRCLEFGPRICDGCDQAMQPRPDRCVCPGCGASCQGRFSACPEVWSARAELPGAETLDADTSDRAVTDHPLSPPGPQNARAAAPRGSPAVSVPGEPEPLWTARLERIEAKLDRLAEQVGLAATPGESATPGLELRSAAEAAVPPRSVRAGEPGRPPLRRHSDKAS